MSYTHIIKSDGFGSQYQGILITYLYCKMNGLKYIYSPLCSVEHNYDGDEKFIEKLENLMNIKNNIENNDSTAQILHNTNTYPCFEQKIDDYCDNEHLQFIKDCFWQNKERDYYKNNKINIAIHIRRPNIHDNRIDGTNTPNSHYLQIIDSIRNKYNDENILFHIYSQGNMSDFNDFVNDDVCFYLNHDIVETFIGLVAADVLVMSRSSLSYISGLLSDGEIYYLPFWHPPRKNWIAY